MGEMEISVWGWQDWWLHLPERLLKWISTFQRPRDVKNSPEDGTPAPAQVPLSLSPNGTDLCSLQGQTSTSSFYPKSNVAADIQISTPKNSQFTIYTSFVRQYVTICLVYSVSELEPENEADRKSRKLYRAERNIGLRQSQGFALSLDCSMYIRTL